MSRAFRILVVALSTSLVALPAFAQTITVSGRVYDPQGSLVSNATVTLIRDGSAARTTQSASDGSFSFDRVAPGPVTIQAVAPGFRTTTQTVTVGTGGALTLMLELAGVSEDVSVQGALLGTAATGKTTLPLRELPMTIDTISTQTLAEQGANDLITALRNVPGVNPFRTYGVYEYYAFRGILDSVQLLDGVRNEGNRVNTQLTNVERIDVLKGPASALYGGAALGATVNLIRKKPSALPAYDFSASGGSFKTGRAAFGAGGRLGSDARLYRLDVGAESKEGYRHDDAMRFTLSPSIVWRAGGRDQINLSYTFNRDRFGGDAGLPLTDLDFGAPVVDNVIDVPRDRNYRTPQDEATSVDQNLQVAYARQFSDTLGFRDTLSYRHFDDEYFLSEEVDFSPPRTIERFYLYFKHHRRPLMNIAELTGHFTQGVEQNVVAGWETQRYHNFTSLPEEDFFDAAPIDAFNPVETQGPSDLTTANINYFTNRTNAFYVQDHLSVTPRLKVLLGGRYDIYRRSSHSDTVSPSGAHTSGATAKREAEAFTARLGAVYQAAPTVDLYGSFANAFKPLTLAQPEGSSLDPETGSQFEFGQRFHVAGGRTEINTAVYRILRQKVAFRRPGNRYVQAGEVESRGFEADLQTTLANQVRLNASYGFTDAQFLDYEETAGENLRGNTPTFAPRHTLNIWSGYDFSNGFGVNLGVRYVGSMFADNTNVFEVDGHGELNAAVRYRRGRVEYSLNLNNLTDTTYFVPHLDYAQVYPGDPINVLGTVRVRLR